MQYNSCVAFTVDKQHAKWNRTKALTLQVYLSATLRTKITLFKHLPTIFVHTFILLLIFAQLFQRIEIRMRHCSSLCAFAEIFSRGLNHTLSARNDCALFASTISGSVGHHIKFFFIQFYDFAIFTF